MKVPWFNATQHCFSTTSVSAGYFVCLCATYSVLLGIILLVAHLTQISSLSSL